MWYGNYELARAIREEVNEHRSKYKDLIDLYIDFENKNPDRHITRKLETLKKDLIWGLFFLFIIIFIAITVLN